MPAAFMSPPTREQKIGAIRAACLRAHPELRPTTVCTKPPHQSCECPKSNREIRLADVLIAIRHENKNHTGICIDQDGLFLRSEPYDPATSTKRFGWVTEGYAVWDLYKDDLNMQGDEEINFLYSIFV